ncbi:unnamed protein product, partial [Ectocarpus sp. 4 AP-2014]
KTAEILFVVDESGSMLTEHQWLNPAIVEDPELEGGDPADSVIYDLNDALATAGITNVRYGLLGFPASQTDDVRILPFPGEPEPSHGEFVSVDEIVDVSLGLSTVSSAAEDGYLAIEAGLAGYDFRAKAPVNVILITDEDRNADELFGDPGNTKSEDRTELLSLLAAANAKLNVVVNATHSWGSAPEESALGVLGDGYYAVPDGAG